MAKASTPKTAKKGSAPARKAKAAPAAKTVKPAAKAAPSAKPQAATKKAGFGFPEYKAQMNKLIKGLRDDCAAVAEGKGNEEHFFELVRSLSRALFATKKKQGHKFE